MMLFIIFSSSTYDNGYYHIDKCHFANLQNLNFIFECHDNPEIDRLEGGHVKISPIIDVEDRTQLTPNQAIELMRLTIVAGDAMKLAMGTIGVEIGRINYQDNGSWKPQLHIHLYCRAKTAVMQKYGDPIIPGHRDEYKPLNLDD